MPKDYWKKILKLTMIVFIINNIFEIALALTIVILKIGWLVDKLKVKKELELL